MHRGVTDHAHMISFDTDGRALLVNLGWVPRLSPTRVPGRRPTLIVGASPDAGPAPGRRVLSTAAACDDTKSELIRC